MWPAFPFKYQSYKLKIVGFVPSWNGIPNQESYHVQIINPGLIFHCSALFIPGRSNCNLCSFHRLVLAFQTICG